MTFGLLGRLDCHIRSFLLNLLKRQYFLFTLVLSKRLVWNLMSNWYQLKPLVRLAWVVFVTRFYVFEGQTQSIFWILLVSTGSTTIWTESVDLYVRFEELSKCSVLPCVPTVSSVALSDHCSLILCQVCLFSVQAKGFEKFVTGINNTRRTFQ